MDTNLHDKTGEEEVYYLNKGHMAQERSVNECPERNSETLER